MRDREMRGLWFLPDHQDDPAPGRLIISDALGVRLELDGWLQPTASPQLPSNVPLQDKYGIVHGVAERMQLSLIDARLVEHGFSAPGSFHESYVLRYAVVGALLESEESLRFVAYSIALDDLPRWAGEWGATYGMDEVEGRIKIMRF